MHDVSVNAGRMRAIVVAAALVVLLPAAVIAVPVAKAPGSLVARALAGPLAGRSEIIFAVRSMGRDGHWYANFGHHSQDYNNMQYGPPGGKLCRLDLRTGKLTVLLHDAGGGVRDPQVHYDGRKILFSYRKSGTRYYRLYEINVDGTGLRQITDDAFDDLEPIYLPDGDIIFCSSRCNRFVQCWFTQVAILYRCGPNGENIRPISANIEQDNTPWVLPDGRILYMRWEYVDRSRVRYHHLWTINPDGTAVMVYFGNMHPNTVMLDPKPILGTDNVVSVFSPGHGRKEHAGRIAIVTPKAGPDARQRVRYVGKGGNFRDPYALTEDLFLTAENNRLLLIDSTGRSEEIYRTGERHMMLHEPRPLRPRPRERVIPSRVQRDQPTGRLILADVTHGRRMAGVKKGEIKKLLVLETLPKPVNHSGTMEPISLGGTFTLPRILGTVPVEPDGSAYMELPALRPLFFVALDENDLSVKRMQSFVSVMPGETTSCSGCHENRTDTARTTVRPLATLRAPNKIEPISDVPQVMDFPRDIQPILDKHCVRCHGYAKGPPAAMLPLVGARGGTYSHSYFALMSRGQVSHGRDAAGNVPPRGIGSSASPLMKKLDGTHHKVKLTPLERTKIRLWIESGAPYPGTYAALGCGMSRPRADAGVLDKRCGSCHAAKRGPKGRPLGVRLKLHPELLYNLTDPAASPILLAPLAKKAGGWGLCKGEVTIWPAKPKPPAPGKPAPKPVPPRKVNMPVVFASAGDPDYRKLLAGIAGVKRNLERMTRFDMPNFRPRKDYVREMKRYGFIPPAADPATDRLDVYAIDEAYWRSFWHTPTK